MLVQAYNSTAALYAAYVLAKQLILICGDGVRECQENHALQNVYLGPTLSVNGPQYFQLLGYVPTLNRATGT